MLLVPTVQCWSYRSLFSRSGFSKESLEQIKQNLVLHRNEIWRVRFCECIYYKYFLNACILTYVSFEGRQNQIRKHIQHNRSYNFHRLKSVSRNPSVKGVPPPPPHPRLALTDENVLKSYEAATAQICWFFFFSLIFLTSLSSNWCQLHLWTFSFSSLLIKQLKWREQYMRVEREIGEEECFLLFAAAAIQPLLPHCCHWVAPLMPLFSNAIFRRKKMANSNQYWKRNENNVRSIWIVYLFPMFKTMAKNGGVPFFRHRL